MTLANNEIVRDAFQRICEKSVRPIRVCEK